jgi:hypothetical protein
MTGLGLDEVTMKSEIKDLWIKAAKSGEFKQGRGYLEKGGKCCILGVLSLLALSEGQCTYQLKKGASAFDNRRRSLSYNVMNWAGIGQDEDDEGEKLMLQKDWGKVPVMYRGKQTTLADLNDSGLSLEELADIIEANWRSL